MTFPGGKGGSGVAQKIISWQPPHDCYVEGFLGGGSILNTKRPAARNIAIEKSPATLDAFVYSPGSIADHDYASVKLEKVEADFMKVVCLLDLPPKTLIYVDPPYLLETRRAKRAYYDEEMLDEASHTRLLQLCKRLPYMIQISHYYCDLYASMLANWTLKSFWTVDRGGNRREECLWMNYCEPSELHDYRFIGEDFTDRQRIKRKQKRWQRMLADMPPLERAAMLAHLQEVYSSS